MKSVVWYIAISTLLSMAHYLFGSFSPAIEWYVYVGSEQFSGISILMAFYLYWQCDFTKIGTKLFLFSYLVISCGSLVAWLLLLHSSLLINVPVLLLISAYWFFKAHNWNLNHIRSDHIEAHKTYIMFRRPHNFRTWVFTLFGSGIGTLKVVVNGSRYHLDNKLGKMVKDTFTHIRPEEIAVFLTDDQDFESYANSLVGSGFTWVRSNCLTVWKDVFAKYDIRLGTIFPSVFFLRFLKAYRIR